MASCERFEFGPFVLDVPDRRLVSNGAAVALEPKAHDLLVALVRRAGHLVTKDELLDLVWPGTHVQEGILSVHISALRKALGDSAERRYIETVSRAGYRFTSNVVRREAVPEVLPIRWPLGVLPASPAVHEHIGRGRTHLLTNSRPEIPKAIEAFQAAIDLDSTYAPAHAGLALAHCAAAELRWLPPADAYASARTEALRALAMDDACADAQVALGAVLFLSDWNWTGARRSLERALDLDPDHTDGSLLYGRLLDVLGDLDGGLAARQKALERNPTSARVQLQIAHSYWNQRQYDKVIEWANRALETDPTHLVAREYIAGAHLKNGNETQYQEASLTHAALAGAPAALLDEMRQMFAAGGRRRLVTYGLQNATAHGAPPMQLALFYGELGDFDNAFRHLDHAIDSRDPCLVDLGVSPQWDCLRQDPRLAERLDRMGLNKPQVSSSGDTRAWPTIS
jgi:DNA-binding winged helix-turn-helix (wHTH) protein